MTNFAFLLNDFEDLSQAATLAESYILPDPRVTCFHARFALKAAVHWLFRHDAEAARRFKLSTQMPTTPVYYTSGPTREIRIGSLKVKLLHASSGRKLQHAGEKPGLALSALWYLGENNINIDVMRRIEEGLSEKEFETLRSSRMPAWMSEAFRQYEAGRAHG